MVSNIEIVGYILISVGVIYIFLKAMGILKGNEEGEFECKMFILKGGPGLILVGLGVILLLFGPAIVQPDFNTLQPTPTKTPVISLISTPEPTIIETSIEMITSDYLIGAWYYATSEGRFTYTFFSDGTYQIKYVYYDMEPLYTTGVYKLADSNIVMTDYMTGMTGYYSLTYIDKNSFRANGILYQRLLAAVS